MTYYRARIRLADDSRVRVDVPPKYSVAAGGKSGRERAEDYAEAHQEREDETGELLAKKRAGLIGRKLQPSEPSPGGETCDEWYARFQASAKERGKWMKWISPHIGAKPIAAVTRNDVEDIRDALDVAIAAWVKAGGKNSGKLGRAISGKSTMNIWSCLTTAFKAASSGKNRELRVLDGQPNPCVGVQPPGDRESRKARRKTFVWPKEAAVLL